MNSDSPVLYILCGLPFSGKTTLAKRLVGEFEFACVSIDEMLVSHGFSWDRFSEYDADFWKKISQESTDKIGAFLKQGRSVVYDSANQDQISRDKLQTLAEEYHIPTRVIHLDVPEDVIRKRWKENKTSRRRFDLPEHLLQAAIDTYEKPTADEHVIVYAGQDLKDLILQSTPTIRKAGAIIASAQTNDNILLLFRAKQRDWSFPKGHVEADESPLEAAIREIKEETGLAVTLVRELPDFEYVYPSGEPVVAHMFYMKSANDSDLKTEHAGDKLEWVNIAEALEKITAENLKEYVKKLML